MDLETILNKKKREKVIYAKYFPILVSLGGIFYVLNFAMPELIDPITPYIFLFFIIALSLCAVLLPELKTVEKIIYHLKMTFEHLSDTKKSKEKFCISY